MPITITGSRRAGDPPAPVPDPPGTVQALDDSCSLVTYHIPQRLIDAIPALQTGVCWQQLDLVLPVILYGDASYVPDAVFSTQYKLRRFQAAAACLGLVADEKMAMHVYSRTGCDKLVESVRNVMRSEHSFKMSVYCSKEASVDFLYEFDRGCVARGQDVKGQEILTYIVNNSLEQLAKIAFKNDAVQRFCEAFTRSHSAPAYGSCSRAPSAIQQTLA